MVSKRNYATLDYLSGGRVILGVGGGWNAEEMGNHGTVYETRFKLMRERIEAIKAIWTQDVAEYRGAFVDIEPMWCNPKPVQKPHPPILVGGAFPYGARRALQYGDGWMPIGGRDQDPIALLPRFRQMCAEAGRDPASVPMSVFGPKHDLDTLKRLRDAGMERTVLAIPTAPRDAALASLDGCASLMLGLSG